MSLYAWVILGTIAGPFALSFDKKVHFYTHFRALVPAILLVAAVFLVWDEYFTVEKIWGFTDRYILGAKLGHLPYEEVSFFLVVPFACVFVHEVLKAYFPKIKPVKFAHYFAFGFTLAGFLFGLTHMEKWYTASACIISALLTIGIYFVNRPSWYAQFVFTFIVALIPFLIVNGILTGAVTDEPIVWYSADHIMGPRIITIPVEDIFYNYCMLLPIVGLFEFFSKRRAK
jgi:lycopene cyclase domain-containing protein